MGQLGHFATDLRLLELWWKPCSPFSFLYDYVENACRKNTKGKKFWLIKGLERIAKCLMKVDKQQKIAFNKVQQQHRISIRKCNKCCRIC